MKLRLSLLMVLGFGMVALPGCLDKPASQPVRQVAPAPPQPAQLAITVKGVGDAATSAIAAAEPVVAALEAATGKGLPPAIVARGQSGAQKIQTIANAGAGIATTIAAIPGPQQPIALAIGLILTTLGGVASAVSGFFDRRKRRRTERALGSTLASVDDIKDIGKRIQSAAIARGVGDVVEAEYRNSVAK